MEASLGGSVVGGRGGLGASSPRDARSQLQPLDERPVFADTAVL